MYTAAYVLMTYKTYARSWKLS